MKINPILDGLKQDLVRQLQGLPSSSSPEMQQSLKQIQALQFPGSRQEEWKYSPFYVDKDAQFVLSRNANRMAVRLSDEALGNCTRIVFVDGIFEQGLSDSLSVNGLTVNLLNLVPNPFSNEISGYENTIFSHLNQATALEGGIQIAVDAKSKIEDPLVFIHLFSETDQAAWIQPRIQIQVGEGAEVSFAELWQNPDNKMVVANSLSEVQVASEASVHWLSFENGSTNTTLVNQTRAEVAEKGVFQHKVISIGEGYVRNNLEIKINGTLGDAHMYGLTLGNHRLHTDHHTFVNHKAENTTSNQLYKAILAGKSNGVFNGKILVDQVAQKTNAYQSSKNILLSGDAKVNAKPQLEIFADDVKCSHGATIGQLDEEPIFYLRSRGLDEATAKHLLIQAFAAEIFDQIEHEGLRQYIGGKVTDYMKAMLPVL